MVSKLIAIDAAIFAATFMSKEIEATSSQPEAYTMLKALGVELPLRRSLRGVPRRFDQADMLHLVLSGFLRGFPRPFD